MVNLAFGSVMYAAVLLGCYDGDTCTVRFENALPPLAVQGLRFAGFDTPELGGRAKCTREKSLAKKAKKITEDHVRNSGEVLTILEKTSKRDGWKSDKGKYGRLLVRAPKLKDKLKAAGLAHDYDGGKRRSWC